MVNWIERALWEEALCMAMTEIHLCYRIIYPCELANGTHLCADAAELGDAHIATAIVYSPAWETVMRWGTAPCMRRNLNNINEQELLAGSLTLLTTNPVSSSIAGCRDVFCHDLLCLQSLLILLQA